MTGIAPLDPAERAIVRAVMRLEARSPHVAVADLARALGRTRHAHIDLDALVEEMVRAGKLFSDHRDRFDPRNGQATSIQVIRVNARHPAVRARLGVDV